MLASLASKPNDALAGATPYLRLFGSWPVALISRIRRWRPMPASARGETDPRHATRIADARFFAENLVTAASGLETTILEGADSVNMAWAAE